jgi:nitrogen fixation NifU-like protein
MYSEQLLTRFLDPAYSGDLVSPDGVGVEGNVTCGDVVQIQVRVRDGLIAEARFRTLGCATAIAAADAACELAIGSSLASTQTFQPEDLVPVLGEIPESRLSCASIALGALRSAVEQARCLST